MASLKNCKWFHEELAPHEVHMHGVKSTLYSKTSQFQQIDIIDTEGYGLCLVLDGKLQSTESDEFIYHEALVHAAMLTHPEPHRVMIIGGGEGATLREALRYPSVNEAVMVDIDKDVVESCREHLPRWHQGAFDDPRSEVLHADARKYLEDAKEPFDVIIIDLSDPIEEGPAYLLFTREFYNLVNERLTEKGIIAVQAGATSINSLLNYGAIYQTLKTKFPVVRPYQAFIPAYGWPWGFSFASKVLDPCDIPTDDFEARIAQRVTGGMKYLTGALCRAQFVLPKHIAEYIEKVDRIIEDNHPLYAFPV